MKLRNRVVDSPPTHISIKGYLGKGNHGFNFFKWDEGEPNDSGLHCSCKDDVGRMVKEITALKELLQTQIDSNCVNVPFGSEVAKLKGIIQKHTEVTTIKSWVILVIVVVPLVFTIMF